MKGCHRGDFSALHPREEEASSGRRGLNTGGLSGKQERSRRKSCVLCAVDCVGRPAAGPVELPDGFKNSCRGRIMAALGPLSSSLTCIRPGEAGKC